jgi:hypothetical protein
MNLMDEDLPFVEIGTSSDAPSGLAIDGDVLYSTGSINDSISFGMLTQDFSFQLLGTLDAIGLDYPTTAAIFDKYLCAVNARLESVPINYGTAESTPEFSVEFFMTCIDRSFDE